MGKLVLSCLAALAVAALALTLARRSQPAIAADEHDGHAEHGESHEHPELAKAMAWQQRWTMKLGYAIAAKNQPLADLYMHELEESTHEIIEAIPEYEGLKIAQLTRIILEPELEPLAQTIDTQDWAGATQHYAKVIDACNRCHSAVQHAFIEITVPQGQAPWNQQF